MQPYNISRQLLTLSLSASGAVHFTGNLPPSWGTKMSAFLASPKSDICNSQKEMCQHLLHAYIHTQHTHTHVLYMHPHTHTTHTHTNCTCIYTQHTHTHTHTHTYCTCIHIQRTCKNKTIKQIKKLMCIETQCTQLHWLPIPIPSHQLLSPNVANISCVFRTVWLHMKCTMWYACLRWEIPMSSTHTKHLQDLVNSIDFIPPPPPLPPLPLPLVKELIRTAELCIDR